MVDDCACACCVARGDIDWQGAAERHADTIGKLRAELGVARRLLSRAYFDREGGWHSDISEYLATCGEDD